MVFRAALVLLLSVSFAHANEEGAFLDKPYRKTHHVIRQSESERVTDESRNDVEGVIGYQSPVKAQEERGTCSIFSSMGILESLLMLKKGFSERMDLSEEYLQYVVTRFHLDDGSDSESNFEAIFNHGATFEQLLPYNGEYWEGVNFNKDSKKYCGHLTETLLKSCLIGHRDPALLTLPDEELEKTDSELYDARVKAYQLRDRYILKYPNTKYELETEAKIKKLLRAGIPISLDVDFYYGAWNHHEAEDFGIEKNEDHWARGIVGYPLKGSVDEINSHKEEASHSVVVVGYDDKVELELKHLMPNGKYKKVTHKGVYYFKNSWGTRSFGRKFEINGTSYPGYGMMVQDYAHDYGNFYQLPLK